jgi:hypothetical protein
MDITRIDILRGDEEVVDQTYYLSVQGMMFVPSIDFSTFFNFISDVFLNISGNIFFFTAIRGISLKTVALSRLEI